MSVAAENGQDDANLFHQLDRYPWDDDPEFQGGLRAILGSVDDPAQVAHLTLRAKCYYYARRAGTNVDFDGYKRWVESGGDGRSEPVPANDSVGSTVVHRGDNNGDLDGSGSGGNNGGGGGGMTNAPKPASFAEICDMIAEGKPIPGIKDIPDTILEGQASESQAQTRRKPWEKDAASAAASAEAEKPSWMA